MLTLTLQLTNHSQERPVCLTQCVPWGGGLCLHTVALLQRADSSPVARTTLSSYAPSLSVLICGMGMVFKQKRQVQGHQSHTGNE